MAILAFSFFIILFELNGDLWYNILVNLEATAWKIIILMMFY